jgi:HEAT repeat protein
VDGADAGDRDYPDHQRDQAGGQSLDLHDLEVRIGGCWKLAMKKRPGEFMRIATPLVLLATAVVSAASTTSDFPGSPPKEVSVHFRFEENVVTLHEPVVLFFEVHNGLSQPITVTVGALVRQYFDFSLTTPSGQAVHRDPFEGRVDIVTAGDGKIIVAPGSDYKESLILNQWFSFENEGTYVLASKLTSDIETEDGSFAAKGESAQVRVNPRDAARLNKICAELAKQVETAPDAEAAQEPARALSYVDDPIAVPYLRRVLSTNTLTSDKAIEGLAKIGNDAAVEALLSALNDSYGDIPDLTTNALARIQNRITDPHLKETVKSAVQRSSARLRNEFLKTQIAYLGYRDPNLQTTAIQTLMRMDEASLAQAEPALQRLANDPNQPAMVVEAAKAALQKLHPRN